MQRVVGIQVLQVREIWSQKRDVESLCCFLRDDDIALFHFRDFGGGSNSLKHSNTRRVHHAERENNSAVAATS